MPAKSSQVPAKLSTSYYVVHINWRRRPARSWQLTWSLQTFNLQTLSGATCKGRLRRKRPTNGETKYIPALSRRWTRTAVKRPRHPRLGYHRSRSTGKLHYSTTQNDLVDSVLETTRDHNSISLGLTVQLQSSVDRVSTGDSRGNSKVTRHISQLRKDKRSKEQTEIHLYPLFSRLPPRSPSQLPKAQYYVRDPTN